MITYDDEAVQRFLNFSTLCPQSKHPFNGKPISWQPWQIEEWIKPIYGQYVGGERLITNAGLFLPKKSGKSCMMSVMALFHLLEFPGSEIAIIAAKKEQAEICFREAAAMVESGPLNGRLVVSRNDMTIEDRKRHSVLKVLPMAKHGLSGPSYNLVIFDELWDFGPYARDAWQQLQGSTAARRSSLKVVATTAQFTYDHIGREQLDYAKACKKDPTLDERYHSVIYECENKTGEEWKSEKFWRQANPSADITFPFVELKEAYKKVLINPREEAQFRTLRLNQFISAGFNKWLTTTQWEAGREDFKESDLYGLPAYYGIDAARRHDLFSYSIVVPKDEKLYIITRAFLPESRVEEKERKDKYHYRHDATRDNPHVFLTPGDCVDPLYVERQLLEDCKNWEPVEIGFDPACGMELIRQKFELEHGLPMVEVPPTKTYMSPAIAFTERAIIENQLRHNSDIMSWCIMNCQAKDVGDDMILLTKAEDTQRIDCATALCIAMSRYMASPDKWVSTDDLISFF